MRADPREGIGQDVGAPGLDRHISLPLQPAGTQGTDRILSHGKPSPSGDSSGPGPHRSDSCGLAGPSGSAAGQAGRVSGPIAVLGIVAARTARLNVTTGD